ncbi:hypothetical protein L1987_14814 [Smallanthus sonchifolius]|uniref:Uncharacterized protein n=1 Tax=Smallanthus sonchifolius TaxID=185202 RepID=A0ACB9J5E6_9ASTR|nr:hypothetical protein L1987_14814 [Smallanthus sonchifolius]
MHIRIEPSFFLTNKIGAPQGDELGLMNPFSSNSSNCFFRSSISVGANLYGALAIGAVTGTRLILNSTSHSGGIPGSSSGKTSGNSATTGTSSIFFLVSMVTDTRIIDPDLQKHEENTQNQGKISIRWPIERNRTQKVKAGTQKVNREQNKAMHGRALPCIVVHPQFCLPVLPRTARFRT